MVRHFFQILILLGATWQPVLAKSDISCFAIARLKYGGGGDWYSNQTSLTNLHQKLNSILNLKVCVDEKVIELLDVDLYQYPILYMTGHGNVTFSPQERKVLRKFLYHGGLLIADDNYGMHESFMREMKLLFENYNMYVLPNNHPIYSSHFKLPGIPKIHEHDGKPAQMFGLDVDNRTVVLHTYESDLGDGWENAEVHNNSPELRNQAFQMGVNLVAWYLQGQPSLTSQISQKD